MRFKNHHLGAVANEKDLAATSPGDLDFVVTLNLAAKHA